MLQVYNWFRKNNNLSTFTSVETHAHIKIATQIRVIRFSYFYTRDPSDPIPQASHDSTKHLIIGRLVFTGSSHAVITSVITFLPICHQHDEKPSTGPCHSPRHGPPQGVETETSNLYQTILIIIIIKSKTKHFNSSLEHLKIKAPTPTSKNISMETPRAFWNLGLPLLQLKPALHYTHLQ